MCTNNLTFTNSTVVSLNSFFFVPLPLILLRLYRNRLNTVKYLIQKPYQCATKKPTEGVQFRATPTHADTPIL